MRLERFVALHLNTVAQEKGHGATTTDPPPSKGRARALIAAGEVQVNGRTVLTPGFQVFLGNGVVCDQVEVQGTLVTVVKTERLFVLHKPAGVLGVLNRSDRDRARVVSGVDRDSDGGDGGGGNSECVAAAETLADLVPDGLWYNDLAMLGRLDKPTTGLCLLARHETSGIGALMLHPEHHVRKSYRVHLAHNTPLSHGGGDGLVLDACRQFEEGLVLADGTVCKPAALEILPGVQGCCVCPDRLKAYHASQPGESSGALATAASTAAAASEEGGNGHGGEHLRIGGGCGANTVVRVTIAEGKFHQIKRMLAQVGGEGVHLLHRETFGALSLDQMELPVGAMRPLSDDEYRSVHAMLPASRMCPAR